MTTCKTICKECNINQCHPNKNGDVFLICQECMNKIVLDAISTEKGKIKLSMEIYAQIKNNMMKYQILSPPLKYV